MGRVRRIISLHSIWSSTRHAEPGRAGPIGRFRFGQIILAVTGNESRC